MKELINNYILKLRVAGKQLVKEKQGDNSIVNFLVGVLVAAVCGVLLFAAVNAFFPTFIQDVFTKISRDLLS